MGVTCMLALILAQTLPPSRDAGSDGQMAAPTVITAIPAPKPPEVSSSIDVTSQLGKRFRFVQADVMIDGQPVAHREASGSQELSHVLRVFEGPLEPGPHAVTVTLTYAGRNAGPFTYLGDYRYVVAASANFDARPGPQPAALDVVAREKPGLTVPLEDKPTAEIRSAPNSSAVPVLAGSAAGRLR